MSRMCTYSSPSMQPRRPRARLLGCLVLAACALSGCRRDPGSERARDAGQSQGDSGPTSPPRFLDVTDTHLASTLLGGQSMDAAAVDIDADGDLDIVIASEYAPNILLVNDGAGRFTNESRARIPQEVHDSEDVGVADFDRDGDLDIVVVSEDDRVHELYFHDGAGRFIDESTRIPVQSTTNGLVIADLDRDDDADMVLANNGQDIVLVNDGAGRFTDETALRLPAVSDVSQDIDAGDVDGDGDLDLVLGNEDGNRLLINDGTGRFQDAAPERLPRRDSPEETRDAELGDVDGDGDLDLFFGNVRFFVSTAALENRLLINDGTGRFTDQTADRLPQHPDSTVDGDFVDIDDDGDLDLITGNTDGLDRAAPFRVLRNDGAGRFTDHTAAFFPETARGRCFDALAADFDGDGRTDFFFSNRGDPDRLLLQARP